MHNTMKLTLIILAVFTSLLVSAQTPNLVVPAKPTSQIASQVKPAGPQADTLITKDPTRPNREYWVIKNASGSVKMQGAMVNGQKDGAWREYGSNNNMLLKMEEYTMGKKDGASTTFTNSGMVSLDETYRNDTLNGTRLTYSQGARLKVVENFKKGQLDGERKSFYDDGKVQEEGFYIAGNRDGLTKWFLQSGTPSLEYTYKNGVLDGPSKSYDEKGAVKSEGNFVNDAEEGEWKEYVDGTLTKKIIYKNGNIIKEIPVPVKK